MGLVIINRTIINLNTVLQRELAVRGLVGGEYVKREIKSVKKATKR